MKKLIAVCTLSILPFVTACPRVIEDGEVGVSKFLGSINDNALDPGITIAVPLIRWVEVWNVKTQEHKEVAEVPSSEGLLVGLDTSLIFNFEAEHVPTLRQTVGQDVHNILVVPYLRNAVRDVVSGYQVKSIYSDKGRREIADRIKGYLVDKLNPHGIIVQDVLLRDIRLPEEFKKAIETKLNAEQRAEQKEFELIQAQKNAEIEIAKATGAAKAQEIVQSTLTERYLQYLWIETLNDNPNVVYVATEANLPIFKPTK